MTKSEKTRQFIVEQAASIINKKGIAGTSIADVMEATKLAKGGVYGNFDSKDELCLEVFSHLSGKVATDLNNIVARPLSFRERIFKLLEYYEFYGSLAQTGGCPLLNFGIEADDTNPRLRLLVAKAVKSSIQRIARLIEQGKAEGEFRAVADAGTFSTKAFAMIEGGIFISRVTNNPKTIKQIIELLKMEVRSF